MPSSPNSENNIVLYHFVKRVYRFVFIAIIGLIAIVVSAYWIGFRVDADLQQQENLLLLRSNATTLSGLTLGMRNSQIQFLIRKDPSAVQEHHDLSNRALVLVGQMGRNPLVRLIEKPHRSLNELLQQQMQKFDLIAMRLQRIGLSEKSGLHQKLRSDARALEEALNELKVDTLLVSLLMMRRHEKDFLVRGQKMSLIAMNRQMQIFAEKLRMISQVNEDQYNLKEMLHNYRTTFIKLAKDTLQLEQDLEEFKLLSKEFQLVLDNTSIFLTMQSERVSHELKYDFAWFKSLLGGFALILIFVLGFQGLSIIRQMTKSEK